ncbi:DUF7527 domain-containing protein [Halosimplex amylolyticum]|uniref:DUF7527 domain-containing protein n=1 Tax=Halosimplex amylolyticum TaxID=3396616 RepID=UPI003F549FAB
MTTRAVEQFDEWESSPFRDGYRGLHDLAEGEFSGIVEAGAAKLCMLNGTVVGILDGDIDSFEDATGTAYEAPSPALPLLALMQERNDEVRAKYYSEDTPLSEVDDTLADGGFTGFIELSENVLSGDYYVVYHRGRSMAVAWVGNSNQLLTDDEAFDRADDEVGIFEVRPAEIDPVEIPEVESDDAPEPDTAAGGAAASEAVDDAPESESEAEDAEVAADDPSGADGATGAADPVETQSTDATASPDADEVEPASGSGDGDATASASGRGGTDTAASETADAGARDADDRSPPDDAPGSGSADRSSDANESTRAESGAGDATESTDRSVDRRDEPDRTGGREARDESTGSATDPARDESRNEGATGRTRDRGSRDRSADARAERTAETDREGSGRTAETDRDRSDRSAGTDRDRSDRRDSRRTTESRSAEPEPEASPERTDSTGGPQGRTSGTNGRTGEPASSRNADTGASGTGSAGAGATGTPEQLATHSIPSLDPDRTTSRQSAEESSTPAPASDDPPGSDPSTATPAAEKRPGASANGPPEPSGGRGNGRPAARDEPAGGSAAGERPDTRSERSSEGPRRADAGAERSSARVADLEAELEEREAEIERLEADLAAAETERDDLRAELEAVRTERDDLQSRIDPLESERDQLEAERDDLAAEVDELEAEVGRLESQLQEIEAEFGDAVDAERRMSPGEALDQTNLFVRYESKGKATLETAHAGDASREKVGENLGLEYHTQFERDNVSVSGRPFDEFLRETIQFQFVTWVINDLLYEIRDTGKVAELQALYDAIPKIDRAELNGTVATEYTEDGQERRSQESFDVVMRDRMGNPLLTANMNDSRQAASESMMSALVTASSHVGESTETLGASFLVTSSFFEPEALETAAEATSGGLLSRDKRESFVKLSRKQGYHLCLVEAREEKFHLAVPEL